jgi:hypothetical protein
MPHNSVTSVTALPLTHLLLLINQPSLAGPPSTTEGDFNGKKYNLNSCEQDFII